MISTSQRITSLQKTLRYFEQDIPLLNLRVKDLSAEHQRSARQFADSVIIQTRAELHRLLEQQPPSPPHAPEDEPCEPAD
ncbi:MAG TPA: hypothetical protein VND65_06810 [Candidatus Binatia bacterium]|nr:hypothetical protein [Candidatus Binatia bacterium]